MKTLTLFILLAVSTAGYSQTIFGQEMSETMKDENNNEFSLVEPNGYEIEGVNNGDTIYYNDIVVNFNEYPLDFTYVIKQITDTSYKVVGIKED